jgi:hypothetical protein
MSRIHVTALLALSAFAVPTSTVFAQFARSQGTSDQSNQGGVHEKDLPMCQAGPGGSRVRPNCEDTEPTTLRTVDKTNTFLIEIPALPTRECGATTTTESRQLNTVARVNTTLKIEDCTAASGAFTIALVIKDESGADKPLEFEETWQRSDDQDVEFTTDYPIGENVDLLDVRMRALSCTCADDLAPAEEGSE